MSGQVDESILEYSVEEIHELLLLYPSEFFRSFFLDPFFHLGLPGKEFDHPENVHYWEKGYQ
jgi:hypothetical protein